MARSALPRHRTKCAVCDEPTGSVNDPPLCRDCHWLLSRGRMSPRAAGTAVKDAMAALMGYRVRLGVLAPPTTAERLRWCLDYCRARGAYLRANSGRLRPAVPVPHTVPESWHGSFQVKQPPIRSRDNSPAPGP